MAIADVITGGFGTFSSVNMIPTRGFSIGSAVIGKGLHVTASANQPLYRTGTRQARYSASDNQPRYKVIE